MQPGIKVDAVELLDSSLATNIAPEGVQVVEPLLRGDALTGKSGDVGPDVRREGLEATKGLLEVKEQVRTAVVRDGRESVVRVLTGLVRHDEPHVAVLALLFELAQRVFHGLAPDRE